MITLLFPNFVICLLGRVFANSPGVTLHPHPHHVLDQSSNHSTSYAGRWSTSGWGGNAHFLPPHKNTIGGTGENKTDEQTRTTLGVNQEQKVGIATLHECADYR